MLEALYLIRHAEPNRSTGIAYNIVPGPPLTEAGLREAEQAAIWLADQQVEHLFSSPFERTRRTAAILAHRLGLEVAETPRLGEGAPGEREEQVRARMSELLTQIDDTPWRRIGLVTHGVCIKMLLLHTTGDRIDLSRHRYDYGNHAPTAGIWRGVRGESGAWKWELAFQPAAGQPVLSGQAEQVRQ